MHEKRNFIMILLLAGSIIWAAVAWVALAPENPSLGFQRWCSALMTGSLSIWLVYALRFEDKIPHHLKDVVGELYYEADGLSFMPIVRCNHGQAELCVYYQNRYENSVHAIIHLRPPQDSFIIRPGLRDVHFAFKANGGDFGVIHQPIAVPTHLQGDVVNVQLAAATWYPRSHGARFSKKAGMPCGSLLVDWGGAAFRVGVHEVSGEITLNDPATLHLSMPKAVAADLEGQDVWTHEKIEAGVEA